MEQRFVLVTGASTGIGRACALHLDQEGFTVFATVRKTLDGEALQAQSSKSLIPILLDVTQQDSIRNAIQHIETHTSHRLYGLVNNAGIAPSGPLECLPPDSIREIFDINVLGLIFMIQACLPMLKQTRGRIVNIGSSSGLVAMPMMSTYSATKFGVKAISESLRLELKPFGIMVSLIAPGKIQSEIWEKAHAQGVRLRHTENTKTLAPYQPFFTYFENIFEQTTHFPTAEKVAKAVQHALEAPNPRPEYLVGSDALGAAILSYFPANLRDWVIGKSFKL